MPKKKMILEEGQVRRLSEDSYKRALVDHGLMTEEEADICETVDGITDKSVEKRLRLPGKVKKREKKEDDFKLPDPAKFIHKHITRKANSILDDLFG